MVLMRVATLVYRRSRSAGSSNTRRQFRKLRAVEWLGSPAPPPAGSTPSSAVLFHPLGPAGCRAPEPRRQSPMLHQPHAQGAAIGAEPLLLQFAQRPALFLCPPHQPSYSAGYAAISASRPPRAAAPPCRPRRGRRENDRQGLRHERRRQAVPPARAEHRAVPRRRQEVANRHRHNHRLQPLHPQHGDAVEMLVISRDAPNSGELASRRTSTDNAGSARTSFAISSSPTYSSDAMRADVWQSARRPGWRRCGPATRPRRCGNARRSPAACRRGPYDAVSFH